MENQGIRLILEKTSGKAKKSRKILKKPEKILERFWEKF
jgi:hypothetical protein